MIVVPLPRHGPFPDDFSVIGEFFKLTIGKAWTEKNALILMNICLTISSLGNVIVTTFTAARGRSYCLSDVLPVTNANPSSQARDCQRGSPTIFVTLLAKHKHHSFDQQGNFEKIQCVFTFQPRRKKRPARRNKSQARRKSLRAYSISSSVSPWRIHNIPYSGHISNFSYSGLVSIYRW